jgi:hypothetical protein
MAIDNRINLGIVIKGQPTEIDRLLKIIESQLGSCKIIMHKINSGTMWIHDYRNEDDVY